MSHTKNALKWTSVLLLASGLAYFAYYRMVMAPAGTATLAWTAPTQNEHDEPLNDLAGYDIHCWADAGRYARTIHVNDPTTTSYVIEGLAPGTYSCAIVAINEDGDESALSNVVAKSVQ